MRDAQPSTVVDALGWATEQLDSGRVTRSRREALDMWSAVTQTDPVVALARSNDPVALEQWCSFKAVVDRRVAGEPLAYALGRASFRTLELQIDRRVLIPRPETEGLVQLALDWVRRQDRAVTAADIGTGSGCIALSLAVEGGDVVERVVATDASEDALAVAVNNMAAIHPAPNIEWRSGDLLTPLRSDTFDLIVSNPPYVTAAELARSDPAVRDYEPRAALLSGDEGMYHVRRLLERGGHYLTDGGLIALEIDASRSDAAWKIATRCGWRSVRVEPDVFARDRYLLAVNSSRRERGWSG